MTEKEYEALYHTPRPCTSHDVSGEAFFAFAAFVLAHLAGMLEVRRSLAVGRESTGMQSGAGDGTRVEIGPGRDAPEKTVTRSAVREMIFRQESHMRTT